MARRWKSAGEVQAGGDRASRAAAEPAAPSASSPRFDVRRLDVGHGIYFPVPVANGVGVPAGAERELAGPVAPSGVKWSVPVGALPVALALAGAAIVRHGVTERGVLAAGVLAVLAVLAAIDVRSRVLPNRIVIPATLAVLTWQVVFESARLPEWIGAGLGAAVFLALPSLFRRGAVGMGDVKLAVLLGVTLGVDVANALLLSFLATVPVTLALVLRRRARGATLPFGPFLAFGAAVVLLA
jgi:leader peptidase (prepilin peptidase)/N-methyltransferase